MLFIPLLMLFFFHSPVHAQWAPVTPPAVSGDWLLNGGHFASANEGWAVGASYNDTNYNGVILHYQNGPWTSVVPPLVSSRWSLDAVSTSPPPMRAGQWELTVQITGVS